MVIMIMIWWLWWDSDDDGDEDDDDDDDNYYYLYIQIPQAQKEFFRQDKVSRPAGRDEGRDHCFICFIMEIDVQLDGSCKKHEENIMIRDLWLRFLNISSIEYGRILYEVHVLAPRVVTAKVLLLDSAEKRGKRRRGTEYRDFPL